MPEFTCLCPLTGQADFASFTISYVPDDRCVELKSLELYMWSYRDERAFPREGHATPVADDLLAALSPRRLRIEARWNVRGGIGTVITIEHPKA